MDAKALLSEALRLSPQERAALAGELIQSLDTEVDADAEAVWAAEIQARVARLDAGRPPQFHGRRPVGGFTQRPGVARVLEYLAEALGEAEAEARLYAERSPTAALAFSEELDAAESAIASLPEA